MPMHFRVIAPQGHSITGIPPTFHTNPRSAMPRQFRAGGIVTGDNIGESGLRNTTTSRFIRMNGPVETVRGRPGNWSRNERYSSIPAFRTVARSGRRLPWLAQ